MQHQMRRHKQALSREDVQAILEQGTSGVLALCGKDGIPYGVPLSYVYHDHKLYFHCAKTGHKLDVIADNPNCSFCVIHQDQVMPAAYTTYYQSVIVFGKIRILTEDKHKQLAVHALCQKYCPNEDLQRTQHTIEAEWASMCLLELEIAHMSGKQAKELIHKEKT